MNEEKDTKEISPSDSHTSPVKIIVSLWLIILIMVFYESERVLHYSQAVKINSKSEATSGLSFQDIYIEPLYLLSKAFEGLKVSAGIHQYWDEEKKIVQSLSESPVVFGKVKPKLVKTVIPGADHKTNKGSSAVIKDIKPAAPYKVLIIGDSNIREAVGIALEKSFMKYDDLKVLREGVYSTGLSRPDYFDWTKKLTRFIKSYQPNVVVIMMGTNDAQAMYSINKKRFIPLASKTWDSEYKSHTLKLLKVLEKENIFTYWLGLPIMEKAYFRRRMRRINNIHEQSSKLFKNVRYIGTWDLFKQNNQVQRFMRLGKRYYRVRLTDGIHLSTRGGIKFSQYVVKRIAQELKLSPKKKKTINRKKKSKLNKNSK